MTAYIPLTARELRVGQHFVTDANREEAERDGWSWLLVEHDYTPRGDYSSVVENDGTTWTERFKPDDRVWLVSER